MKFPFACLIVSLRLSVSRKRKDRKGEVTYVVNLGDRIYDLLRCRISHSSRKLPSEHPLITLKSLLEESNDVFPSIHFDVYEWNLAVLRDGEHPCEAAILLILLDLGGEVGHVEARLEEGGGDGEGSDVGCDLGFGVEVRNASQLALAKPTDINESGEDEVFDASGLIHH